MPLHFLRVTQHIWFNRRVYVQKMLIPPLILGWKVARRPSPNIEYDHYALSAV